MHLRSLVSDAPASATKEVARRAAKLRAEGRRITDLSLGELDFDTPQHIRDAAVEAIGAGLTKYTPVAGIEPLRVAACEWLRKNRGARYAPENVVVGCGAKQLLFNSLFVSLEPGDEVIVPAPYWVSYPAMTSLCGGTPKILRTGEQAAFKMQPEDLEAAITSRTRWLILNSPCNPTGAVYSRFELGALSEVLLRHPQVGVISDEIYAPLVYGDADAPSIVAVEPLLSDRTLLVTGVSKAFAMTGWRVGVGVGPADLMAAISKTQSQSTSHTSSISQAAAAAAFDGDQDCVETFRAALERRRDLLFGLLMDIDGLSIVKPDGAFYLFVSVQRVIGRKTPGGESLHSDVDVANHLLTDYGLATVPGAAFGMSPYVRLSFAASDDALREGAQLLQDAVASTVA